MRGEGERGEGERGEGETITAFITNPDIDMYTYCEVHDGAKLLKVAAQFCDCVQLSGDLPDN